MDEYQFEKAFKEYFGLLCNVAYPLVKDQDVAKDIVQHVFLKLWDKRSNLEITVSVKAYLYKAVINSSINYLEKIKKKSRYNTEIHRTTEQITGPEYEQTELLENYKKAVECLPPKCQTVFALSRYKGLTNKEIASQMDISVKAVEKHMGKALKFLKERLGPFLKVLLFFYFLR